MRVLTVGTFYPPQHTGGYELNWQGCVQSLRARGHDVRVLVSTHHERASSEEDEDVHRELRLYWRDYAWPRLTVRERVRLERNNHAAFSRHARAFEPDIVSFWAMGGLGLSLLAAPARLGLPQCGVVGDEWMSYGFRVDGWLGALAQRPSVVRRLAGTLTRLPTAVDPSDAGRWLFNSRYSLDAARARGGWRLPDAYVAHPGVEPRFPSHPQDPIWRGRLLYVGRIDARKGVLTAIDAIRRVPGATLTVVGDGPDARAAREHAAPLGGRVVFRAQVGHDRLGEVYAGSDAVVFPSEWEEPWGLVPLEAMTVGRPVLMTGTGGSGEYLEDGVNAIRFPPGDAGALAAAVTSLAQDPDLRQRLVVNGFKTAAAHTASRFADEVEGHLREVASAYERREGARR